MYNSIRDESYQIPFPLVFTSSTNNTTNLQLNKTNELDEQIKSKKKIIKSLISTNLGACQFIKKTKRKPSILKKLEHNLKKYLFGKNGRMTNYIPNLPKQIIRNENKKKNEIFNTKIDAGELTYLNYKENECRLNPRMNLFRKSNYFNIKKDHLIISNIKLSDDIIPFSQSNTQSIQNIKFKLKTKQSKRTRNMAFTPNQKIINYLNKKNSINVNTETSSITLKETTIANNTIGPNDHTDQSILSLTNNCHAPLNPSKAKTFTGRYSPVKGIISPIKTDINNIDNMNQKQIKKELLTKANIITTRQVKLEKKLFKIIDKVQKPEDKFTRQKDIEEIFNTKAKKKKKKGQTKALYLKAVQGKNDYRWMDSDKADMLKLSDTISNMPDDMALGLADRLIEQYYKKSLKANVDFVQMPEIIKRKREKEYKVLRNRVSQNNQKMIYMKNELMFEKNRLIEIINETNRKINKKPKYVSPD